MTMQARLDGCAPRPDNPRSMVPTPHSPSPSARRARIRRPATSEVAEFYRGYVDGVPGDDVLASLEAEGRETERVFGSIDESRGGHRYAPGKWSIKELLGHVIDGERVFSYRALRMARGDTTPLPSFDQDLFVANAGSDRRTLADLSAEFRHLRSANLILFRSLSPEDWERHGTASNVPCVVCMFPWILVGHELHHRRVLVERYL